ncbi:hypothetical protein DL96DRAFT_1622728 [Flagelloscypha sp. PMI_526]|nr:hypothetical protein DL96DRAFT_1622728 [Flagelloscypha sp. PMI_526]
MSTTPDNAPTPDLGGMVPPLPPHLALYCPTAQPQVLWEAMVKKYGVEETMYMFEGWRPSSDDIAFGSDYPQSKQDPVIQVPLNDGVTLYYHRSYPKNHPEKHDLTWSFYIGKRGFASPNYDIIPAAQLKANGITVKMEVLGSRWSVIDFFVVDPRTTIRVEYQIGDVEHVEELRFPSDPASSAPKLRVL